MVHIDIWTTVLPTGSYTPQIIWSNISSDARLWTATNKFGVPMNATFKNATVYSVRPRGQIPA